MKYFIPILLLSLYKPCIAETPLFNKAIEAFYDTAQAPFYFGVASGDPKSNRVVLWTKLVNIESYKTTVSWVIATDSSLKNIVQSGKTGTDTSSAYTVKLNVENLAPYTTYFYQFTVGEKHSPIGRTKTAPNDATQLKFAVVSCNNYTNGYFNAYRSIAQRNDIDAVIHLGDYIYEYGNNRHKKGKTVRSHIPDREILILQDYRTRYAQYRLDKDLQEAHRLHPFITEWDDHETANNSYKDGAQNHQANEGDWEERKSIAKRVYFEWLPIQDNDAKSVIRKISYGNLADVFMLDERLEARSKQLNHYTDSSYLSSERHMIGDAQSDWLEQGIKNSKAIWKVIANQVMLSEIDVSGISKKIGKIMDIWDGYPVERDKIMQFFYDNKINNIIVITGDIHSAFAFDLVAHPKDKKRYNPKTGAGVIGAEFVCTSISSSNIDERVPRGLAKLVGSLAKSKKHNPHLRYTNVVDHGYTILTLTKGKARADWYYMKTVKKKTDKLFPVKSWSTLTEKNSLFRERN